MKDPIIDFKDETQLKEYGKMWQDILYLNDWIIDYKLVDNIDSDSEGLEIHGHNTKTITHKEALIKISRQKYEGYPIKICDEQNLIHELLHCQFEVSSDDSTIENLYYETMQHQNLEFMARSLLRARYNLSKDWFNNIH